MNLSAQSLVPALHVWYRSLLCLQASEDGKVTKETEVLPERDPIAEAIERKELAEKQK